MINFAFKRIVPIETHFIRSFSLLIQCKSSTFENPVFPFFKTLRFKKHKFIVKRNQEINRKYVQLENKDEAGDTIMEKMPLEEAIGMALRIKKDVVLGERFD